MPTREPNAITATLIWGAGAPVGNSDGQFANAFVQATSFTAGNNPTSWTALSINEAGGSAPGNAYWKRSLTGRSQGAYVGTIPAVSSPSQANGVAIFDSDFLDNGGVAGAFGTGTSPSPHRGELISPRINLTGYTNTALAVNLYSHYRAFAISSLSVSISTNDGATWSAPVDYRAFIGSSVEGFALFNLVGVTDGVANLSQSRIKLIFDGDYYFAIIDDLTIQTVAAYDLTLGVVDPDGATLAERGDVVHITGSRHFPVSQLSANHFAFGAVIKNLGAQDVLPAQAPALNVLIERKVGMIWTSVFTDSIAVTATITAGGHVAATGQLANYAWAQTGDYRVTYTASFNGLEDLTNNSLTHEFTLTPDDYASKVGRDGSGDPLATGSVFPGGVSFTKIEFGSVFYVNAGATSGLRVDAISFRYRLNSTFTGSVEQDLIASIYVVDPGTAWLADRQPLALVGVCVMSLTGLGTVVLPGQYGLVECSPFDATSGQPLGALSTGHYFVSVAIDRAVAFGVNDVPLFGRSSEKNYNLNLALSAPGNLVNVSAVALTPANQPEQWYAAGFGATIIPTIGVHFARPDAVFGNGFETASGR